MAAIISYAAIFFLLLVSCASPRLGPVEDPRLMAELGRQLFFDPRLSKGNQMSCATCHQPARAFTNGKRVARGVHGEEGERNVPTLINRAGTQMQFWDGRAKSLEDQVMVVITAAHEMGASLPEVIEKLSADADYRRQFDRVFGGGITKERIAKALAAFERRLVGGPTPYDQFMAGDPHALTEGQKRGMHLFKDKFRCVSCHAGNNFSDEQLRPRCYPATNNLNQFVPIHIPPDKLVKTPTLRNLVFTAPYLHTGELQTLEEVVDFYSPSFQVNEQRLPDNQLPVVRMSPRERRDLVDFLKSLSAAEPYREATEF